MKVRVLACACVCIQRSHDRTLQGEFRQGHSAEGKVKTSRVVQHIGEAVQAQARPSKYPTQESATDFGAHRSTWQSSMRMHG